MNTSHEWCDELKYLIQNVMYDTKQALNNKEKKFVEKYIIDFDDKFNDMHFKCN